MTLNVRPIGDRILVEAVEEKELKKGGIIIPDTAKEKPETGTVVAVGPGKKNENGTVVPVGVQVGDKVMFSKYGFDEIKLKGEDYYLISENNIFAILN